MKDQTKLFMIDGTMDVVDHGIGYVKKNCNQGHLFVTFTRTFLKEDEVVEKEIIVNVNNIVKFEAR